MDLGMIIRLINGIIALGEIWLYLGSDCLDLVFEDLNPEVFRSKQYFYEYLS